MPIIIARVARVIFTWLERARSSFSHPFQAMVISNASHSARASLVGELK
jgi:hypothetical protein